MPTNTKPVSHSTKRVHAWAAVGKKSGKVLHGQDGRYAIYMHHNDVKADVPIAYWDAELRGVSIRVLPRARDVRGILKGR